MENIETTNPQVVKAWQEMIDEKDFSDLEIFESADVESIKPSGSCTGIKVPKQMLNAFAKAFSNHSHQDFNYIEKGEWIAIEGIFTATHAGDIKIGGAIVVATYRKVNFNYSGFIKVMNGKVVESRLYYDSKMILGQLGLE